MKQEIQDIIEMTKAGKISSEQAAELIEALSEPQAAKSEKPQSNDQDHDLSSLSDIGSFLRGTISSALNGAFEKSKSGSASHLSRIDAPQGHDFTFDDNSINVSSITELKLENSHFDDNAINGSKLHQVSLTDSSLSDCSINGSSIDKITLTSSHFSDLGIHGSKCAGFSVTEQSRLSAVGIQGCSLKDVAIADKSTVEDCRLNGVSAHQLTLSRCKLSDVGAQGVAFKNSTLSGCTFANVKLKGLRIADCKFSQASFSDISFTGRTAAASIEETEIENCTFADGSFSGCIFSQTGIRNVRASGFTAKNIDFTGMKIDSTEAFMKVIGRQ